MPAAVPARSRCEAARRGAQVVAIDVAPTLIALAQERSPKDLGVGSIEFLVGDMSDPALGTFDHVVAMDSLIHYNAADVVTLLAQVAARTNGSILFTYAPRTPALALMHAVGPLLPPRRPRPVDRAGGGGAAATADPGSARVCRLADRAHPTDRPRLLHLAGLGVGPPMSRIAEQADARLATAGTPVPAVRGRRVARVARCPGCCGSPCSRSRSAWPWCCSTAP